MYHNVSKRKVWNILQTNYYYSKNKLLQRYLLSNDTNPLARWIGKLNSTFGDHHTVMDTYI